MAPQTIKDSVYLPDDLARKAKPWDDLGKDQQPGESIVFDFTSQQLSLFTYLVDNHVTTNHNYIKRSCIQLVLN